MAVGYLFVLCGVTGCEADPGTWVPYETYRAPTTSGAGGAGGTAGGGTGGTAGGGGSVPVRCTGADDCATGLTCCDGACVNIANDILNCARCGQVCEGPTPFCSGKGCDVPPCADATCGEAQTCCNELCCNEGELCCELSGRGLTCVAPENGTCPVD